MMAQKTQYCYCYCSHSRWHTNYNSDLLSMSPMHRLLHDILCIVVILMGSRHNFWSLRVYSWKIICIIIIIIILYWFHIEICRACHVTKNSEYSCAKIRIVIDLKLSVNVLSSLHNKYRQFHVHNCFNSWTRTFSIFGHVTCSANFKRAD